MVSFAVRPAASDDTNGRNHPGSDRCPLCSLPAATLHPHAGGLHARIVLAIRQDFPEWQRGLGLCLQCADLYDARASRNSRPGTP
jgi:hypothetical protein